MQFQNNEQLIKDLKQAIQDESLDKINALISELHPVDIADITTQLSLEEVKSFFDIVPGELISETIAELEEDEREGLLNSLTPEQIARKAIDYMESDDAADLIMELPKEKRSKVIALIDDVKKASNIVDLLNYPDDSAGGLMAKELFKVNINWDVMECVQELRKQAEQIETIHTVYVVDENNKLLGTLSLKSLILTPTNTKIEDVLNRDIISVKAHTQSSEVAQIMEKYDLVVLPVVDDLNRLKGRITIDDVVDVIKEEAERDYQMASGLSDTVEAHDSVWQVTKARVPWLLMGMIGGVGSAHVLLGFDLSQHPEMVIFIPLIGAMGGNVGVQSSAIVVQGLANNTLKGSIVQRLIKETGIGLVNGLVCSAILFGVNFLSDFSSKTCITVSIALLSVIIFAAILGTFIPLLLNRFKVNPALATGPFITTTNDIFGLLLYFYIGQMIIG
ncbi:MAG: magnesium transporter [Bacteroidetes bacterium]|nr:magnesium transporter [Bacteroidota bacterium]